MNEAPVYPTFWQIGMYTFAVFLLLLAMVGLSFVLGQRHRERLTGEPYESGMPPTGGAQPRFDVKFYLVAMFFVIFDLEAVFIFAWSVVVRETGWPGYGEMLVFIAVLMAALAYLWHEKALDWGVAVRKE